MSIKSLLEVFIDRVPGETRLALTENGQLKDLVIMGDTNKSLIGNIYFARVEKISAGMNAAFVDIGVGVSAFLAANDGQIFDSTNEKPKLINKLYKEGDNVLVQVTRDGSDHKGAKLTTRINLVGRLVIVTLGRLGISISKRIPDKVVCGRIKNSIQNLENSTMGLIIRTNAQFVSSSDLQKEAKNLSDQMFDILSESKKVKSPTCIYQQSDQILNFLRDFGCKNWNRIIISDRSLLNKIKKYILDNIPELIGKLELAYDPNALFENHELEQQISGLFEPIISLPSGGRLIIEETEALVAVDVDSGKFNRDSNPEMFAVSINEEAVIEFARQLILRNLTGQIVIDFLPMKQKKNRNYIKNILSNLLVDVKNCNIYGFSRLGLLEMNRQRLEESLLSRFRKKGGGNRTVNVIIVDMIREVLREMHHNPGRRFKIVCSNTIYSYLKGDMSTIWAELIARTGPVISVEKFSNSPQSHFELTII